MASGPHHKSFKDRVGENLAVDPRDEHKWYYYPRMMPEEALLFKTFDSADEPGLARFTIHSAFDDPKTPPDAPMRESIETRVVAIFAPTHEERGSSTECPHACTSHREECHA